MSIIVILYWTWFAVSVAVLARRAVRRAMGRTPRSVTVTPPGTDRLVGGVTISSPSLPAPADPSPALPAPAREPSDAVAPALAMEPTLAATASEPSDAVGPAPLDAPTPSALAGTVFAPRPTAPPEPTRSPHAGLRVTLAEALAGIRMPADLAPLVNVEGVDGQRRAVFATTGRAVEDVGAALAEELARLGYALEALGPADALAKRGPDALALRLRTIGPAPKKGPADPKYPTAPAGAVVVDVELT